MELPKRKSTRLREYDYSQNGAYFVTICTDNRAPLFGEIAVGVDAHIDPRACLMKSDCEIRLSNYGKIVKKYIERIDGIHKYVIMPNHVHLLIIIDRLAKGDRRVDVGINVVKLRKEKPFSKGKRIERKYFIKKAQHKKADATSAKNN